MSKSDLYSALLPRVNAHQVELLDVPQLVQQLGNLERRTARSGRDSIDHPPRQRDDLANAVAGVCSLVATGSQISIGVVKGGQGRHEPASHALQAIQRRKSEQLARELAATERERARRRAARQDTSPSRMDAATLRQTLDQAQRT